MGSSQRPTSTVWVPACDYLIGFDREQGIAHAIPYSSESSGWERAICGAKVVSFGAWISQARANLVIPWPPKASDWKQAYGGSRCTECFKKTGRPRPNDLFELLVGDGALRSREPPDLEKTREEIAKLLAGMFKGVETTSKGDFTFPFESTRVYVRPFELAGESMAVDVFAITNVDLMPSRDLFRFITLNANAPLLGHLSGSEREGLIDVSFSHRLCTGYFGRGELEQTVISVAVGANEIDDMIQQRFGGRRYIDVVEGRPVVEPPSEPSAVAGYL